MWIVKIALDRPYTFIVLALLILLLSPVVLMRTPVDMFPAIKIPVVSLAERSRGIGGSADTITNASWKRHPHLVVGGFSSSPAGTG
jgi:multidrug efflux pump subunit AcrB